MFLPSRFSKIRKYISNKTLHDCIEYIFFLSFISYLFFWFLDTVSPGFVTNFISIKVFTVPTFVFGILFVLLPRSMPVHEHFNKDVTHITKTDHALIWFLSVFSACVIYWRLSDFHTLRFIMTILSFLLILLVSYSILISHFDNEHEE